jgi:asparagine synthase (glutamine-hydrolysing)
MCGLAGVYRSGGEAAESSLLLAMAAELRHRGPDGTGLYVDGPFGMTNTRLAIVDLEGGDQPLPDETGRYWVMQNGEVYNYVELRDELRGLGRRFATTSDTEVIAQAYAEWGPRFLDRLNGDFAIAIWAIRSSGPRPIHNPTTSPGPMPRPISPPAMASLRAATSP